MVVKRLSPPVFEQAFEGYVLACEAMVGDLDMFTGGADVEVIEVFDEALAFFLKHARAHNSWRKITEALNLNILAGAGRLPSKGARSLKRIAQTLAKRPAPGAAGQQFEYRRILDRYHEIGREVAQRFHSDELGLKPTSMVCDVTPAFCDEVYFSHGQTCGVPVMDCGNPDDRRITFRIADAHCGIRLFLCLPMLFMHEYACHVYCDDDGFAPIFNEGWLFHASCRYMKRHWATGKWHELLRHHVEAHEQQWEQRNLLKWPDSVGWFLARRLLDSLKDSRAFNAVTRDLASTSGTRRAQRDWHSRWLFGLNDEFDRDPQKILRRMYVTTSGTDSWNRGGFLS